MVIIFKQGAGPPYNEHVQSLSSFRDNTALNIEPHVYEKKQQIVQIERILVAKDMGLLGYGLFGVLQF